jgi:hypothetical protein
LNRDGEASAKKWTWFLEESFGVVFVWRAMGIFGNVFTWMEGNNGWRSTQSVGPPRGDVVIEPSINGI